MSDISSLPEEELEKLMIHASAEGRADVIGRLLSSKPALKNCVDEEGLGPLHHAVLRSQVDAVRSLLRAGVPAEIKATSGEHAGKTARQLADHDDSVAEAIRGAFAAELLQSVMLGDADRTADLLRGGVSPSEPVGPGADSKSLLEFIEDLSVGEAPSPAVELLRNANLPTPSAATPPLEPPLTGMTPSNSVVSDLSSSQRHGHDGAESDLQSGEDTEAEWMSRASAHDDSDENPYMSLLWPPPKKCWPLNGEACAIGDTAVVWLPSGGGAAEATGVRSAAWAHLHHTLVHYGVALTPTRSAPACAQLPDLSSASNAGSSSEMKSEVGSSTPEKSTIVNNNNGNSSSSAHTAAAFSFTLNPRVLPRPESFRLTICRSGVALVAADAAGLFYGVLCLCQIIDLYAIPCDSSVAGDANSALARLVLPALCVEDSPDFFKRGVVLDARFPSEPRREGLLAQVEQLAAWRVNTLHLVLNSQLELNSGNSTGSSGLDLLELDALCQHHFIELVPAWAPMRLPGAASLLPPPMDAFRQVASKSISVIFDAGASFPSSESASNPAESPTAATPAEVRSSLAAVAQGGHHDAIHVMGCPPDVMAVVECDPLQWAPAVLCSVLDFNALSKHCSPSQSATSSLAPPSVSTSFVKGGCSDCRFGPSLRSAPVLCSLLDASLAGAQCGAMGMLVQGRPWANPFYPACAELLAHFAGAGLAWDRKTASKRLGFTGPSSASPAAEPLAASYSVAFPNPKAEQQPFQQLVAHHLFGSMHGTRPSSSAADIHTVCSTLCCTSADLRQCLTERRPGNHGPRSHNNSKEAAASACSLDEPLWQLHLGAAALPWDLWADPLSSSAVLELGESYKAFNRTLRAKPPLGTVEPPSTAASAPAASFARQEELRWASADAFSAAVTSGTPAQQCLDALHVCLDLLRLSCRLLQQVLHVKDAKSNSAKGGKDNGATSAVQNGNGSNGGAFRPVTSLVKRIPASTRSDLANRFLDLYQRLAVLWGRQFSSVGLPVAFRHPPELLQLLTFDLPNFHAHEMYDRILAAKRL